MVPSTHPAENHDYSVSGLLGGYDLNQATGSPVILTAEVLNEQKSCHRIWILTEACCLQAWHCHVVQKTPRQCPDALPCHACRLQAPQPAHTYLLNYLYSDEAQRIAGDNYYRPSNEDILKEYAEVFDLNVNLVTIDDFGGWDKAQETHFADGGVFDQIYEE